MKVNLFSYPNLRRFHSKSSIHEPLGGLWTPTPQDLLDSAEEAEGENRGF
jgi:hypothetical protein